MSKRDQNLLAPVAHQAGCRLPLSHVGVDIQHIDAEVESVGDDAVATGLARCGEHCPGRACGHAVVRVSVGTERKQRGVEIRLAQAAVYHTPALELGGGSQACRAPHPYARRQERCRAFAEKVTPGQTGFHV